MERIYDETKREVGWIEVSGERILYFTYKYGLVGEFNTTIKQYRRWKCYPGHSVSPFAGADYGMTDVLYWAEH